MSKLLIEFTSHNGNEYSVFSDRYDDTYWVNRETFEMTAYNDYEINNMLFNIVKSADEIHFIDDELREHFLDGYEYDWFLENQKEEFMKKL